MAKRKRKRRSFFKQKSTLYFSRLLSELSNIKKSPDNPSVRTINNAGSVQSTNDFIYRDGTKVPAGTPYHIHTDNISKDEVYMTGGVHDSSSEIITRLNGGTVLNQYKQAKTKIPEYSTYLKPYVFGVTKKSRKLGFARRYFVRRYSDNNVFEINDVSAKKELKLYELCSIKWSLDTNQTDMERKNIENIDLLLSKGFDIELSPLQGYDGGDERDEKLRELQDARKKLKFFLGKSRKKKRSIGKKSKGKKGKSSPTPSSQPSSSPSTGGGGGAY